MCISTSEMSDMWTILRCGELPADISPLAWLERVLPRQREDFQAQYRQGRSALEDGSFDRDATFLAADESSPAGLVIASGSGAKKRIDLIGVHEDLRRQGLGRTLLEETISSFEDQEVGSVTASSVSSRNHTAVRLLESCGFAGESQGALRMRRSLDLPLPPLETPEGFTLRSLQPGEEGEWVRLQNACYREEGARDWTIDDFHREFTKAPFFDFGRIFVALEGERMVGTTSAWEIDFGEGPVGLIHWVGVEPDYRKRGLGKALMIRALTELAARGYQDAWLNTSHERLAAVGLYERMKFALHRELFTYTLTLEQKGETNL